MTAKRSDPRNATKKSGTSAKRTMAGRDGTGEGRNQGRKQTPPSGEQTAAPVIRPPDKPY